MSHKPGLVDKPSKDILRMNLVNLIEIEWLSYKILYPIVKSSSKTIHIFNQNMSYVDPKERNYFPSKKFVIYNNRNFHRIIITHVYFVIFSTNPIRISLIY